MSDTEDIIQAARDAHARGEVISDLQAKVIATGWHGGRDHGITGLSHMGEINGTVETELDNHLRHNGPGDPEHDLIERELLALLAYVRHHGERGPVAAWGALHW